MAWQTPKIDWSSEDGVRDTDFNRIEGNILELYNTYKVNNDLTVYVNASTGNDTAGTGTAASPYKTINKALNSIPSNIGNKVVGLNIAAGTYDEDLIISGFNGLLKLYTAGVVNIGSLRVESCNVYQYGSQTNYKRGLVLEYGATYTGQSLMYISEAGYTGVSVRNGSRLVMYNTVTVSNTTSVAIEASGSSMIYISIVAGNTNTIGLRADTGSVIGYGSMNMTATTQRISNTGGRIYTGSSLT